VTYRLPLGPLGRLIHACGAGRQIAGVFDWRERRLREVLNLASAHVLADDSRRPAST